MDIIGSAAKLEVGAADDENTAAVCNPLELAALESDILLTEASNFPV